MVLRSLIARLGEAAGEGVQDSRDRLRLAVEPLPSLRDELSRQSRYLAADTIRDALHAAGLELQEKRGGTRWAACPARDR